MSQKRYASHFLRIGNYLMPYPLLELRNEALVSLSSFDEEIAATIFIDGVIRLRHSDFPENDELADVDCVKIDLSALQVFLSNTRLSDIEVLLP